MSTFASALYAVSAPVLEISLLNALQLVLGDKFHVPFKPSVESKKITVTVK